MKYTDHDTTVEIREIPKSYWHRTTIGKDLTCIHAYTQCPQMLKIEPQSFDLIYVDGRFRRRCLESASILIKPDGLVILDNAERKWYHETLRRLFDGQFVKMHWWKGKVKAR